MSQVAARSSWWRSLFQGHGVARGDIAGGLTAAVVLLSIEGSYGLVAFARLGPEQLQVGFVLGVCTAALASAVTAFAGGKGPLLSWSQCGAGAAGTGDGCAGSRSAISRRRWATVRPTAAGIPGVWRGPRRRAADTARGIEVRRSDPLRSISGSCRLHERFCCPDGGGDAAAFARLDGQGAADWRNAQPLAPVIALAALVLAVRPPRWTRRVPAYLTGLLAATALHHLLTLTPLAGALGPLFNAPRFEWPGVEVMAPLFERLGDGLLRDKMWLLIQFAAAAAFVSSLQTALADSTVDELTHQQGVRATLR